MSHVRYATPRWVDCLVFLLLMSGPPRLRVRDAAASLRGETDGAVLLRLIVWGCGLAWILVRLYPFLVTRGVIPRINAPQVLGGLLLIVLCAGITVAPGPLLTGFAIYQLAIMIGFSWIFVVLYGPEAYLRYLFLGYLLLAVTILAAWALMPELVIARGRVRGDLIAPAGAVGALGLVACLSGTVQLRTRTILACAGVFSVVMVASQTRTAIAAFLAAVLLSVLFRYPSAIRKLVPLGVVGALAAGLFGVVSVGQQFLVREERSLATMSDRLPLWEHLLGEMLQESPAIGLGYFSASRVLGPQYNPGLGNAHSAFVEILVGGGLLGGALFFALYGALVVCAAKVLAHGREQPVAFAVLGLFLITFLLSVTNTEGIQGGPIGFTFWSTTALLPAVRDRVFTFRFNDRRISHAHLART